jgi:hypothetical protein
MIVYEGEKFVSDSKSFEATEFFYRPKKFGLWRYGIGSFFLPPQETSYAR